MVSKSKITLMGIKKGMTQIFDAKGNRVVCTVIEAEKHVVSQVKTKETDGYSAVQLASFKASTTKKEPVSKPLLGHFKKAGIAPRKKMLESRVEKVEEFQVGSEVGVEVFSETVFLDVAAISKGKGYQGVMKRHNFAGGPGAHGSGFHRHGGSCGMRSTPGRCLPGQKKAGRMGGERVTVANLRVVRLDVDRQYVLVEGGVPGPRGGVVYLSCAKKK